MQITAPPILHVDDDSALDYSACLYLLAELALSLIIVVMNDESLWTR